MLSQPLMVVVSGSQCTRSIGRWCAFQDEVKNVAPSGQSHWGFFPERRARGVHAGRHEPGEPWLLLDEGFGQETGSLSFSGEAPRSGRPCQGYAGPAKLKKCFTHAVSCPTPTQKSLEGTSQLKQALLRISTAQSWVRTDGACGARRVAASAEHVNPPWR